MVWIFGFIFRAVRQHSRLVSSALVAAMTRSASCTLAVRSVPMVAAFPFTTITSYRPTLSSNTSCLESMTVRSYPSRESSRVTARPTLPSPATIIFIPCSRLLSHKPRNSPRRSAKKRRNRGI